MSRGLLVLGSLVVLAVVALCARLGFWQLDRLEERRAANVIREASLARSPVAIRSAADDVQAYQRIEVEGVYDLERQLIAVNRSYRGTPGVIVVTPLRLADGGAVLIERGWVASPNAVDIDLDALDETDTVAVSGVAMPTQPGEQDVVGETSWPLRVRRIDPGDLAGRYPYPLLGRSVRQLPGSETTASPRRLALADASDGPHLSYAIQWFSFALVFAVGLAVFLRVQLRGQDAGRPSSW